MSYDTIEPLEPGTWLARICRLAAERPANDAALTSALRRAYHLIQLTPRPLRHIVTCRIPEQAFEQLIGEGTLKSAAQALIGPGLIASCNSPSPGRFVAEVDFADEGGGCREVAASAAHALFAAWTGCLKTLAEGVAAAETDPARVRFPGRRRSRSAPHPKLTEH